MRILALDTSTLRGSAAAAIGDHPLISRPLPEGRRTAQTLAPVIKEILNELDWKTEQLDLVAVTCGPGSFTGLRIGITTAKTLAYAAGAKVVGVNTLETLAVAAAKTLSAGDSVLPMINVHRNEFFGARYRIGESGWATAEQEVSIVDIESWLEADAPDDYLTGPMLSNLADEIAQSWPTARFCDRSLWTPDAVAVAAIGFRLAEQGECDDVFSLVPNYYRPSYAEEKRQTT